MREAADKKLSHSHSHQATKAFLIELSNDMGIPISVQAITKKGEGEGEGWQQTGHLPWNVPIDLGHRPHVHPAIRHHL